MKTTVGVILGLLMLAGLGAILWIGGGQLGAWLGTLSGRMEPSQWLMVGFVVALLTVMQSVRWSRRRASADQVREVRRPVYESVAMAWQGALRGAGAQSGDWSALLPRDLAALEDLLALRASPAILQDYQHLREMAYGGGHDIAQIQRQLTRLVLRMRRELDVSGFVSLEEAALKPFVAGQEARSETTASDAPIRGTPDPAQSVLHPSVSLAGR